MSSSESSEDSQDDSEEEEEAEEQDKEEQEENTSSVLDDLPQDMKEDIQKQHQEEAEDTPERVATRRVRAIRRKIQWKKLWDYSDDEKEEFEATPQIPHLMRTVVMINVPIHIEENHLENVFSKYGKIEKIQRSGFDYDRSLNIPLALKKKRHLYDPRITSCTVKIRFASVKAAHKVLKKTGHKLGDRHVFMHMADHPLTFANARSAFLGNLPFDIDTEELYQVFHVCGPVDAVVVGRDSESGNCNGIGFIKFASKKAARNAFKLKKLEIRGRPIRVKKVRKDQEQPALKKRKRMLQDQLEEQKKAIKKGEIDPDTAAAQIEELRRESSAAGGDEDEHDPLNVVFPWQGEKSDPSLKHEIKVKVKRNPKKARQKMFLEQLDKKKKRKEASQRLRRRKK